SGASHKLVILVVGAVVSERVMVSSRAIESHASPPGGRFALACSSEPWGIARRRLRWRQSGKSIPSYIVDAFHCWWPLFGRVSTHLRHLPRYPFTDISRA